MLNSKGCDCISLLNLLSCLLCAHIRNAGSTEKELQAYLLTEHEQTLEFTPVCLCTKHLPPRGARINESAETVPNQKGALALHSCHPGMCTRATGGGGPASACCSISVWEAAGNGASIQGTWEMLGIQA